MDRFDDPYQQIAEFYDLEHDDLTDDIGMYLQYVESAGDPVLELACGTGRITVPIAQAGYRIVGADRSMAMLDRARERASGKVDNAQLMFVQAEMADADTIRGGPFGVVIMALGALSHLQTREAQLAALIAARQALDPRGVLLIDLMHASPNRLHSLDGSTGLDGHWQLEDGEHVDRFSTHAVHPATQTIETRIWFDATGHEGTLRRVSTSMRQRYLSPGELLLMLENAGFEDAMLYGGYELEPFEDGSERLIVAAEVTKTG